MRYSISKDILTLERNRNRLMNLTREDHGGINNFDELDEGRSWWNS